jgi:hypothetical protein
MRSETRPGPGTTGAGRCRPDSRCRHLSVRLSWRERRPCHPKSMPGWSSSRTLGSPDVPPSRAVCTRSSAAAGLPVSTWPKRSKRGSAPATNSANSSSLANSDPLPAIHAWRRPGTSSQASGNPAAEPTPYDLMTPGPGCQMLGRKCARIAGRGPRTRPFLEGRKPGHVISSLGQVMPLPPNPRTPHRSRDPGDDCMPQHDRGRARRGTPCSIEVQATPLVIPADRA